MATETTDAPQTAMLLTGEEWDDLEVIAHMFLEGSRFVVGLPPSQKTYWSQGGFLNVGNIRRRRELAKRIIDANR